MIITLTGHCRKTFCRQFCGAADSTGTILRTVQVQVVHRHGDRSPITPLKDEAFWSSTLIPPPLLEKIKEGTELLRPENANLHKAGGRGPFGKLSELGLLQMIQLGTALREQLSSDATTKPTDTDKNSNLSVSHIWNPNRPLDPDNMKVISTDFERTIQSVQGLLVGLFPDGIPAGKSVEIDVRHTNWMIPDPQPRQTLEQIELEKAVARSPAMVARERLLLPLATRTTAALHNLLSPDAREASFGVEQEIPDNNSSIEIEPLSWNQLAEITKCLSVRNLLPVSISVEDHHAIVAHAAWRWFQILTVPRLAYLSMHKMASKQVEYLVKHEKEPPFIVWSAHDSTLIGLLCAYRLEQPAVWPEYASYLMLELIQASNGEKKELYVRFSLNGELLRCHWEGTETLDMIPLSLLREKIHTVGADTKVAATNS
jgi:hypothetical protein